MRPIFLLGCRGVAPRRRVPRDPRDFLRGHTNPSELVARRISRRTAAVDPVDGSTILKAPKCMGRCVKGRFSQLFDAAPISKN